MSHKLTEFLEVIINQILYLRGVYPSQIFKKLKVYNLPVFISIYPPLNNYIKNILLEVSTVLKDNKLKKVEIRLGKSLENNDEKIESYFIDVNEKSTEKLDDLLDDDLETEFRSCIHALDNKCKLLKKLSRNCRFKVFLHVKSFDYKCDSRCQDFLWIEDNESNKVNITGEIIPINMSSRLNAVKFYIEK